MPVIAIVNQKGGTGKTTVATNLAAAFAEAGSVLLLDADAQGSSQDWADSRPGATFHVDMSTGQFVQDEGVEVRAADAGRILQDVRRAREEYDWVIIDGPAGINRVTADAVRAADLVLIPAKPSPFDVWAASTIVDAVKARQAASDGLPKAAFVITMAKTRTLLGRQVEAALEEYELPVLGSRTTERVSYPQMAIEGRTVLDGRDRVARDEILSLKAEIEGFINDSEPQAQPTPE